MIRISDKYSIAYKNGYFISHEYAKKGDSSKNKGEEYVCTTKTYARLSGLYTALKDIGEDGNKIIKAGEALIIEYKNGE